MKEFYTVFLLWLLEDVWGVHGMESVIGIIMPGLFATKTVNPAVQTDGLLIGGSPDFFLKELISVLVIAAYCFVFTYLMLKVINLITPVKVTQEEEIAGLDSSLHGEMAYEEE